MIQVTSPGLPPWPKLWLAPIKNQAMVTVRHPTWRSYEWAYRTGEVLVWITGGLIICLLWIWIPAVDPVFRFAVTLGAWCILFPIASFFVRQSVRDPLARQVFATGTTFWVTENVVVIKSRLYDSPVVIWRKWKDRVLHLSFIVQSDLDASSFLQDQPRRTFPKTPLGEATIIEVVISTPNAKNLPASSGGIKKSIPITEVNGRFAQKFSTVFSAALLLVPVSGETQNQDLTSGIDIDTRIPTGERNVTHNQRNSQNAKSQY